MPSRRRLEPTPNLDPQNWSVRRINALSTGLSGVQRYLEIGLDLGHTFENVSIPYRVGVDPEPNFDTGHLPTGVDVHAVTSNEFFRRLDRNEIFDVIFIDGLHTYRQTYVDIIHALDHCPRGALLIDDVVPSDWISAIPDHEKSLEIRRQHEIMDLSWHGDVFKAMLIIHDRHPELDWVTILGSGNPQTLLWRRDHGTTIRRVSRRTIRSYRKLTYDMVFANGVPIQLRPASEDAALRRAIHGVEILRAR